MKILLKLYPLLATVFGISLILGGLFGLAFTYQNAAREKIETPQDAWLPNTPVRGPLSLKAQADIIRTHTLRSTDGKTFAEMPRQIEAVDEEGNPVLDEEGNPVMVANTSRDMWITATTLMTALNLGLLAYALSGISLATGVMFVLSGLAFASLDNRPSRKK